MIAESDHFPYTFWPSLAQNFFSVTQSEHFALSENHRPDLEL